MFAINSSADCSQLLSDNCSISSWFIANLITLKIGRHEPLISPGKLTLFSLDKNLETRTTSTDCIRDKDLEVLTDSKL